MDKRISTMTFLLAISIVFISFRESSAVNKSVSLGRIIKGWESRPELKLWPGFLDGTATQVSAFVRIRRFHQTPTERGSISFEGYLGMFWEDKRLAFNRSLARYIPYFDGLKNIWIPDIHYASSHMDQYSEFGINGDVLFVISNGWVYLSRRFMAEVHCGMKFNKFPFDEQVCPMYMETYAHTYKEVQMKWYHPYVRRRAIHPAFTLKKYESYSHVFNYTWSAYQYMSLNFHLKRNHGHYVSTWYLPTMLILGLVYIAFWMPEDLLTAKSLLTTSLYIAYVIVMVGSVDDGPQVPYLTEFDKWFLVNFLFMTVALLGVFAVHLAGLVVQANNKSQGDFQTMVEEAVASASKWNPKSWLLMTDIKVKVVVGMTWALRIVFPVAYILFLIIYFAMNK